MLAKLNKIFIFVFSFAGFAVKIIFIILITMASLHAAFSLKVMNDLEKAIKQDTSINAFEVIPTLITEDKNTSPVLRGESTIGLESWAIRHIVPFAHKKVLESDVKTTKDLPCLATCILTLNLLHPEMPTAWNRRKQLVFLKKLSPVDDLRITQMALSRVPKCNEALSYRRWLITNNLLFEESGRILEEELRVTEILGDRYQSNYHAWAHRKWCLERFLPATPDEPPPSSTFITKRDMCHLFATSSLPVYLNELQNNLKFVSSHVSDFSCLSFRMFLINQTFRIFNQTINQLDENKIGTCNSDVSNDALAYYSNIKSSISNSLALAASTDPIIRDYVSSIQNKLSIVDFKLGLILIELKANLSLNEMFENHEALWCYRRFLIFTLNTILGSQILIMPNVAETLFNECIVLEKSSVNLKLQRVDSNCDKRIFMNYYQWLNNVIFKEVCQR